jgi:hypothetical protein
MVLVLKDSTLRVVVVLVLVLVLVEVEALLNVELQGLNLDLPPLVMQEKLCWLNFKELEEKLQRLNNNRLLLLLLVAPLSTITHPTQCLRMDLVLVEL